MAKFHIRLKITGFELEVDGTREDLPVLRESFSQQFSGLLSPATDIAAGETTAPAVLGGATTAAAEATKRVRRRGRAAVPSNGNGATASVAAIDWIHDAAKYGSPAQKWSGSEKGLYVLYVASREASAGEMSSPQLIATFAKHFKQAGQLHRTNLPRDLGKLKSAASGRLPLVSENTTVSPSTWYLTDAGIKKAQSLVAQALGQVAEA